MGKAILVAGKLCSGKTTYSQSICKDENAVLLSVDEIMQAVFGQYAGEKHEEYVRKLKKFLLEKSAEILNRGVNVVLDWGFWTRAERDQIRDFYHSRNASTELHYIELSQSEWKRRIDERNVSVLEKAKDGYYIDDAILRNFESIFEQPEDDEIDIIVDDIDIIVRSGM